MLNLGNEIACTYVRGKKLSSVRGCKRGIAQGNSPYGLYRYKLHLALFFVADIQHTNF